ncbi:hypothetical protein MN608_03922 [Microdochium nivale]|nr:hypothetical protein MN608_03922 [Microdochium nivale]
MEHDECRIQTNFGDLCLDRVADGTLSVHEDDGQIGEQPFLCSAGLIITGQDTPMYVACSAGTHQMMCTLSPHPLHDPQQALKHMSGRSHGLTLESCSASWHMLSMQG